MNINLGENIRSFRKQRSLTQEQLSEILGVTAGAVYKWEAGMSVPDLPLIVEMADFFDTSVDVLLGYEMRDNHQEAAIRRLNRYLHDKDYAGISEAEKSLKKNPNCFDIVYGSAVLYQIFGMEKEDGKLLERALCLFRNSLLLLSQNKDPKIGELTIYGNMAEVFLSMGDNEQAVELLKKYNSGGVYNSLIGLTLASDCKRPDEAVSYLSEALLDSIVSIVRTVTGYINIFFERENYGDAQAILLWALGFLSGLSKEGQHTFLDKTAAVFYACLACAQLKNGDRKGAKRSLLSAGGLAEEFDRMPNYDANRIRFVTCRELASAHDNLGATALDGVEKAIASIKDEELAVLWEEVKPHEK